MELILFGAVVLLEAAILAAILLPKPLVPEPPESIDISPREPKGEIPGGTYEIVAGLRCTEASMPAGVVVMDVKSSEVWVFEVWARTDHGWMQMQPGVGEGEFRNPLLAGVRLTRLRLWLAPAGLAPDERALRAAAGLLLPAALVLTRARPAEFLPRPESRPRSESPPAEG